MIRNFLFVLVILAVIVTTSGCVDSMWYACGFSEIDAVKIGGKHFLRFIGEECEYDYLIPLPSALMPELWLR